eukprot:scaffold7887_cov52-Phaeocystis_antarctica.AAC.2
MTYLLQRQCNVEPISTSLSDADEPAAHQARPCCGAHARLPPHSPYRHRVHQDSAHSLLKKCLRLPCPTNLAKRATLPQQA